MYFAFWSLIAGALLIVTALCGTLIKRVPASAAMLYLAVGFALGPSVAGVLIVDPLSKPLVLAFVSEAAILISLFSIGLKLGVPLSSAYWMLPLRLAFPAMALTVGLIALIGCFGLGLSLGAAILLGGILAPTDPVLASDVQIEEPGDRDRLRFSLSGEGALNDGAAFPFVMLGLGLMGIHELGQGLWRWLAVDVAWALGGAVLIGAAFGTAIGRLVFYLRTRHREAIGLDEFLALGLLALTYGVAVFTHVSTFLALFAAGLALARSTGPEARQAALPHGATGSHDKDSEIAVATHPELAGAHMTQAVRGFNEQLERLGELAIVVMIGAMLAFTRIDPDIYWFLPLLFIVVRPLAVYFSLIRSKVSVSPQQRALISWFGIRGIGSIYYLMYAIGKEIPTAVADKLIAVTLATVTASIFVHGISVTPLMNRYAGKRNGKKAPPKVESAGE